MVLNFEETKELEILKQKHKIELAKIQEESLQKEHERKIKRLEMLLKIAEKGGVVGGDV